MTYPSWGRAGTGGGGGTVDAIARADIAQIAPDAGATITPDKVVFVAGKIWQNTSGGNATLPTPADETTMTASPNFEEFTGAGGTPPQSFPVTRGNATQNVAPTAGETRAAPVVGDMAMIQLSDGVIEWWYYTTAWGLVATVPAPSGAAKWSGVFTTSQTPALTDFVGGVWKGSFNTSGGDLTVTIPAGLGDGDEFHVASRGGQMLMVAATGAETVAGFTAGETADLNIDGQVVFKKMGNDWGIALQSVASVASPDASEVVSGDHYFSNTSGWWINLTGGSITLPATQDATSMAAAGLTRVTGRLS